jgi:glycerol-3-phosphate cytidylyltransferase/D-beta-D-heptose 7-phosphate kinase/D-beta-D-heptose 1-phosphate adenosyltransferase
MKLAIVSGYFNPLHIGHLRMMQDARAQADALLVIVNNDDQQMLKKGKIITVASERLELVEAIGIVDVAMIATDADATVKHSLSQVRWDYPDDELIFCNGGDRSNPEAVAEYATCQELRIELAFGVGGEHKADSSTRINEMLES